MEYFESRRWKGERHCPRCGSMETREASHKTMPYWCKACRKYFSVKTGTPLEKSPIPYRKWLMAIYLMSTSIKGISSTKLGNDLGIKQSHAWFLAHRIRQGWANTASELFGMTVEVDEVYIGGKERNKHNDKKLKEGRGAIGKAAVLGIKDRKGKKVKALKIESTNAQALHWIILENVAKGSKVYTHEHRSYLGLEKKGYEQGNNDRH